MSNIKGFTNANLVINPEDHDINHVIGKDACLGGGRIHFKSGAHILGEILDCEELICDGTLIIDESAKVQCKLIKAQCLFNLGELRGDHAIIPGTLVAWSGSIQVAQIEYAAFEKSANCAVKGSLDQIEAEVAVEVVKSFPSQYPTRALQQSSVSVSAHAVDDADEIDDAGSQLRVVG